MCTIQKVNDHYSSVKMVNNVYINIKVPMECTQPKHNCDYILTAQLKVPIKKGDCYLDIIFVMDITHIIIMQQSNVMF